MYKLPKFEKKIFFYYCACARWPEIQFEPLLQKISWCHQIFHPNISQNQSRNESGHNFQNVSACVTDYKLVIEASILRALKKYLLRQPKTAKNEIIPFTFIYNPNNPNVFPIKKQTFDNFQYSKTMCNIFRERNLSMSQAPNLGRFLCRSKFESEDKNHEVKNF